jgi:CheY-like chemotaxis protein
MGYRALVVEDYEALRMLTAKALSYAGFDVVTAQDGTEAVQCLGGDLPDLLTLDVNIPGVSCLKILETVRQRPGGQRVTIVIISGKRLSELSAEAQLADLVLEKPVGVQELIALGERFTQSLEATQPSGKEIRAALKQVI